MWTVGREESWEGKGKCSVITVDEVYLRRVLHKRKQSRGTHVGGKEKVKSGEYYEKEVEELMATIKVTDFISRKNPEGVNKNN